MKNWFDEEFQSKTVFFLTNLRKFNPKILTTNTIEIKINSDAFNFHKITFCSWKYLLFIKLPSINASAIFQQRTIIIIMSNCQKSIESHLSFVYMCTDDNPIYSVYFEQQKNIGKKKKNKSPKKRCHSFGMIISIFWWTTKMSMTEAGSWLHENCL